ncbi:MAG: Csu type fimbrial protein [Gammaproteobacteria bacterium]
MNSFAKMPCRKRQMARPPLAIFIKLLTAIPLPLASGAATALGLDCSVSASGIAFGVYDPSNPAPTAATGTIQTTCTVLLVAVDAQTNISLNTGASGTFSPRSMSNGSSLLNYNLYQDAAHTIVWGDGSGGTAIVTDNNLIQVLGTTVEHTVYGLIPDAQFVGAGAYSDTITVTVEFHELL